MLSAHADEGSMGPGAGPVARGIRRPAYRSWFKSMTLPESRDGMRSIAVPSRFLRDWVAQHYSDRMRAMWNAENDAVTEFEIIAARPSGARERGLPRRRRPSRAPR